MREPVFAAAQLIAGVLRADWHPTEIRLNRSDAKSAPNSWLQTEGFCNNSENTRMIGDSSMQVEASFRYVGVETEGRLVAESNLYHLG